jgi:hypothetical protein
MTDELPFGRQIKRPRRCFSACHEPAIARGAYQAAAKMYPDDLIELRQGARIVEKSK